MFDLPKYGDGVCLARLADLLEVLSVDRARLQRISVVVTGSNGKGSTAAFCAAIGCAYGLRTGLFTSPHLYRFNERFQIGAHFDVMRRCDRRAPHLGCVELATLYDDELARPLPSVIQA